VVYLSGRLAQTFQAISKLPGVAHEAVPELELPQRTAISFQPSRSAESYRLTAEK
jgi:hypothetical protein